MDEEVFHDLHCPVCDAPSHPASGCAYSETYVICGRCIREAWRWVKGHTNLVNKVGTDKPKDEVLELSRWEDDGGLIPEIKKIFVSFYFHAGKKLEGKNK